MRERGQVTVPSEVREALDIHSGDEIIFDVVDGVAILSAGHVIPKSQAWFWTPEWQAGEREASADIAAGRTRLTKRVEDFFAELDE
jgi:AbrB family looped-hinge helix DNA binding protein